MIIPLLLSSVFSAEKSALYLIGFPPYVKGPFLLFSRISPCLRLSASFTVMCLKSLLIYPAPCSGTLPQLGGCS